MKSDKNKSKNNKKEISIPIYVIILPLIVIIILSVFSFKTYASVNDNTTVEENTEKQEKSTEDIIIKEEVTDKDFTDTEEIEETEQEQENLSNSESLKQKEIQYTASNGETYSIIGKLNIPSLNIEYPILSSTSTALLKISLNRYWGAYPNEVGNMVVVGHNYKNDKFFSNLSKINIGDIVKISDASGNTLDYSVYKTDIVDQYDNSCTSQLTDGKKEITLITCYYDAGSTHATKRFIVKARAN